MKGLKAFVKPFEARQRFKLIFILLRLSKMHKTGRVNNFFFYTQCGHLNLTLNEDATVLLVLIASAKNTVISPNFLMWKFCGRAQFPHSFGQFVFKEKKNVVFIRNFPCISKKKKNISKAKRMKLCFGCFRCWEKECAVSWDISAHNIKK